MKWILLAISIIAEIVGTSALKQSDGFSKLTPTIVVLVGYGIAFVTLALAVKLMDVGVAYAIWAGLATAGVVLVSWLVLGNKPAVTTLLGIGLIIVGVVLVNLTASVHD